MLSLHTNAASLSAQNSLSRTQGSLSTSMTRLSTGYRINSSMDDAAGLQIATRLKAQTSGMAVAMRNTQNSTSMLQTADGALNEVSNILVRMKDLATQSADASSTSDDQDAMQSEYDALGNELNNIMKNTSFGGSALLSGGTLSSAMTFQIGASSSEKMTLDLSGTTNVGAMGTLDTDLGAVTKNYTASPTTTSGTELTGGNANATIDLIKTALDSVGATRSAIGGAANRLDHVYNNLSNISTNTQNATGRIMDVDFATESSNMTSNQMLMQAGTAMLKQTNSMSSMVMSLLQ
jgi:flagellin